MKINIPKRKIVITLIPLIFIALSGYVFYLLFIKENPKELWYSGNWTYRKLILLDIPNNYPNTQEDILIEINTSKLISEGKLQSNCRDIRFVDEDNRTTLKYWIEGGCNTEMTQIWVRTQFIESKDKSIYMYYGNEIAPDAQEEWGGEFIVFSLDPCKDAWVINTDFQGRFPFGSDAYGEMGGDEHHNHRLLTNFDMIADVNCNNYVHVINSTSEENCDTDSDNILNIFSSSSSNIPNHLDGYFCSGKNGYLNQSSIIISDETTSQGWIHISGLDYKYPRGEDEKDIEITKSHLHSIGCKNLNLLEQGNEKYLRLNKSIEIETDINEPTYKTMNFISREAVGPIPSGAILMVNKLPPLGWEIYSDLIDCFPKGSDDGLLKTDGIYYHSHEFEPLFSINTTTQTKLSNLSTEQICLINPNNLNDEFGIQLGSDLPPYISVIFAKKKTSQANLVSDSTGIRPTDMEIDSISNSTDVESEKDQIKITIDDEKTKEEFIDKGDVLGASTPTSPSSLLTEGSTNPTDVSDPTPEFSAIYNDPDTEDTSSNYRINVNTSSDFTGTEMWDSGKMTMTTTNQGERSPDISYSGSTLSEGTTYYWRIKFWDSDDNESPWSSTASFSLSSTPIASELLTCGNSNPTFITDNLTFSAIYTDPGNTNSTYYEIEVNTASNFSGTVMWDTGKTSCTIASDTRSSDFAYSGTSLTHEGTTYYIRMRFWDGNDSVSDWVTGQFTDLLKGFRIDGINFDGISLD